MKYSYELDNVENICNVIVSGSYRRDEDSATMKQFVCDFYEKTGCRMFFFDMTAASITSNTLASYEAGNPPEEIAKTLRRHRTAVLLTEITDDDRFFETVARNRGFNFQLFDEYNKAIEWLKK